MLDTNHGKYVALVSRIVGWVTVKIINPEYTVERIVQRMREASAEPTPSVVSFSEPINGNGPSAYLPNPDIRPINFQPPFQPQDEYHVNDLLKFTDEQFVENAYRAILKRSADTVGRDGFLAGLRSGTLNKVDVLAKLRYSKEGREQAVKISGLLVPAALRALYRIPIAGYLLNLSVALVRLPSIVRSNRQFEAHMLAHEEILVRQINHIGQSLIQEAQTRGSTQQHLLQHVQDENARLLSEQAKTHEVFLTRVDEFARYVEERINDEAAERRDILLRVQEHITNELRSYQQELARTQDDLQTLRETLLSTTGQIAEQLREVAQKERRTSAELALQGQQLKQLVDSESWQTQKQRSVQAESHFLDGFFAEFDELCRGDRETIKDRLTVYLPYLPASADAKIIDVGCGRGEWLELLCDSGMKAIGVELNSVLVNACRERGLDVVEQDLIAYLSSLPNASVSAISAFHVVEHLVVDDIVTFLDEAIRLLTPGGVLLLETPNPRNVLVGSCNFYFDPTHRNPVPSEVLQLLVETRGFSDIQVLPLNPSDATPVEGDSDIVNRFNRYFYGPMDYGLIAHRP